MATISTIYLNKWLEDEELHYHLPVLKRWATGLSHLTEMGTRNVTSTWGLLAAKPKKLVSIDWDHPTFRIPEEALNQVGAMAKQADIVFEFVRGNTLDLEIEPTDLLFIDTWHTYEQFLLELLLHSNQVRKYIVAHDTNEQCFPGMSCAIEDFTNLNPHWKLVSYYENFPGTSVLERVAEGTVNWGDFSQNSLRAEIDHQHELFFKECTEKTGPTAPEWQNYRTLISARFSDAKRWPKTNQKRNVIIAG